MPQYQSLTDDFSQLKFDYVYIPALLLVGGTLIVKRDWTIYSLVIAMAFAAYNYNSLSKWTRQVQDQTVEAEAYHVPLQDQRLF